MYECGLIGRSIMASKSPWLHEQEARAQGLELSYDLFDFTDRAWPDEQLQPLLKRLAEEGYSGVNVTFPFKQAVIPLVDSLEESARSVGAVNTIAMHGGKLVGHNTDMDGFCDSLTEGLPGCPLHRVLLLGAGGAGAAVANALLSLGVGHLEIADRVGDRSKRLATRLQQRYGATRAAAVDPVAIDTHDVDGIVNATPIGMMANPGTPIDPSLIEERHWVADIVYFPLETELLRAARDRGCRVLDGSGMVIGQAARAFQIFTGFKADQERMRASFVS